MTKDFKENILGWFLLSVIILVIQMFVPWHPVQLTLFIAFGFFFAFFSTLKKVFIKVFVIQVIVFTALYFLNAANNSFITKILEALNQSGMWAPIVFVLFNALTTALCFQIGSSVRAITFKGRIKK